MIGAALAAMTMRRIVLAIAIAGVGVLLWLLFRGAGERTAGLADPSASKPASAAPAPEVAATLPSAIRPSRPRPFSDSEPASESRVVPRGTAVVRGRCVDASGLEPLAGCTVQLSGHQLSSALVDAYVARNGAIDWTNPPNVTTTADGRFEIRFTPPPPYQFSLIVSAQDRVMMQGHWREVDAAAVVDVGDVPMQEGARLRGRITDEPGSPQPGVMVHFDRTAGRVPDGVMVPQRYSQARSDPAGMFKAGILASGAYAVRVDAPADLVEPASLEIAEGIRSHGIDVKVRMPSETDSIYGVVVDDAGSPVRGARVRPELRLGWNIRSVQSGTDGSFVIPRPSGQKDPARLTAENVGFEPGGTEAAVAWGSRDIKIILKRGLGVDVVAHDGDRGAPLERYGVRCVFASGQPGARSSEDQRLRERGTHEGGLVHLTGILRGQQMLVVEPEGTEWLPSAPVAFEMTDGGAAQQDVTVWRAVKKTVRVRTAGGTPIAGSKVDLVAKLGIGEVDALTDVVKVENLVLVSDRSAILIDEGTTGQNGTVDLRARPRETVVLRALGPGHPPTCREITIEPGPGDIDVVVPRGATLAGRILPPELIAQLRLPDDRRPETRRGEPGLGDAGVSVRKPGESFVQYPVGRGPAPLAADGSFRIDGIPPGRWELHLHYSEAIADSTFVSSTHVIDRLDLSDGDERSKTYELASLLKGSIEGTVTLDGTPVEDAMIDLDGERPDAQGERAQVHPQGIKTGAGGRFHILVWPAIYRMNARLRGNERQVELQDSEAVRVDAGQHVLHTFDLRSSVLKILVFASDGATPVAGVRFSVRRPERAWPVGTERSDASGSIRMEGLQAGDVTLSVLPKALSTDEAVQEFHRLQKGDIGKQLVRVMNLRITPPETTAKVVLPASAGY